MRPKTGLARYLYRRSALSRRCSVHSHLTQHPAQSSAQRTDREQAVASGSGRLSLVDCRRPSRSVAARVPADRVHGSRLGQLRLAARLPILCLLHSTLHCPTTLDITRHHPSHTSPTIAAIIHLMHAPRSYPPPRSSLCNKTAAPPSSPIDYARRE
jgi:hypothetical protein